MIKKRLLFLTNLLPYPLDDGASFKTYHTLRFLSRNWDVTLISFIRSPGEHGYRGELEKICRKVEMVVIKRSRIRDAGHFVRSLFSRKPFLIQRDHSKKMQAAVDRALMSGTFDTFYADHLHMAQYLRPWTRQKILDEHNLESELALKYARIVKNPLKKLIALLDSKKMRGYEVRTCGSFDLVLTVTEKEREMLSELGVQRVRCLPIGVDTKKLKRLHLNSLPRTVVFLGTMYWPPNADAVLWFCRRIFPLIRHSVPDARLSIIGAHPPRSVRKLAADRQVKVWGYVDDPEPLLSDCAAFVVPLRIGGGMRVKILNAFSWGLPVVSTALGAEGIEALDGRHLFIRDAAEDFAEAVVRLIKDRASREQLSLEGRRIAETVYDWETLADRMKVVFSEGKRTR